MQNFDINNPQSANVRYTENIENTNLKNSSNILQNTKITEDYATKLSVQNSVGNAHNATSHIVVESAAPAAIPTKGKNFLLRFFDSIRAHLKKIFSSFGSEKSVENPSKEPVQSSPDTLRTAPEQNINALNEPEALQEAVVPHNNKKLSFGKLKQNLETRLSELRALSEPDHGQINNLETRLFYLKKLDTMGSFLRLRFQTTSVSKYAKKGQIEDAKKNLEKLEALGVKSLEIPGGFEAAWGDDNFVDAKGNKVPNPNKRLLGALSSSTINLDFKTFGKLYRQLQNDDCLSNKKFNDLMKATEEKIETSRRNMSTVCNMFDSNLATTLWRQITL